METGFRKSMPSGSTRGIMLKRKQLDLIRFNVYRIRVWRLHTGLVASP
jgi:hypothetical protein